MSTVKQSIGSRTQLSGAAAALNSLANVTYVSLGTLTFASSSKTPLTVKLEVSVTPGTVSGNKQVVIFAQQTLDGTNFESGPSSGTTTTDEPDLTFLGTIPCGTNSTLQRKVFDLAAAFGGSLPYGAKIIAKNDSGAALSSSGNDCYTLDASGDVT
ncbi:MAG: hypothetical protein ABI624_10635 [Casimicrobiaceae bacterium]